MNIQNTLGNRDFQKNAVSIYPNPTDGLLNIQTAETIKNISVYNMLEQLVIKNQIPLI